ncbi:unnamed protein product [Euphydryas editha]|uniref:Uncharacterized protein n=1 Tax=Euphydryas editha TaxID=104508 RepID=A0AAU9T6Z4_EUPED|nr:unnamed protein product [Euphydryas editha]
MDAIKNSITELSEQLHSRMTEFQRSLQNSSTSISSPTSVIAAQFNVFRDFALSALEGLQRQVKLLAKQQDHFEMRSRRKMLLVHGIPENKKEDTVSIVNQTFHDHLKIDKVSNDSLSRCYRIGIKKSDQPRPILLKFRDLALRNQIWFGKTGFKNTGITVSEFLTKYRHEAFLMARQRFGIKKCWTQNGIIIIVGPDGKRHRVTSVNEVNMIQNKPDKSPTPASVTASGTSNTTNIAKTSSNIRSKRINKK